MCTRCYGAGECWHLRKVSGALSRERERSRDSWEQKELRVTFRNYISFILLTPVFRLPSSSSFSVAKNTRFDVSPFVFHPSTFPFRELFVGKASKNAGELELPNPFGFRSSSHRYISRSWSSADDIILFEVSFDSEWKLGLISPVSPRLLLLAGVLFTPFPRQ